MPNTLLILTGKNCQRIPPGTLNIFLRLWMITELAQIKIFALKVLQPGGAAIIFPKSGRNQKSKENSVKNHFVTPTFWC